MIRYIPRWACHMCSALMILQLIAYGLWYIWYENSLIHINTPERLAAQHHCRLLPDSPNFDEGGEYCCPDVPCLNKDEVDLRIVVLVYNRPDSLQKVLDSISKLVMDGDILGVDIWIDVNTSGAAHRKTVDTAKLFKLQEGTVNVHVQLDHAGIYGQWINSWRPRLNSKEIALILEDDVDISPYAYRWLKAAYSFYRDRTDIGGIAIYEGDIVHMPSPPPHLVFLHQRIGTQGFSPLPAHWRNFQDWYHRKRKDPTFRPFVEDDTLLTHWYKNELEKGRHTMWDMWWTFYATSNRLWILYPSLSAHMRAKNKRAVQNRYLAYHRRAPGLHFTNKQSRGSQNKLIFRWDDEYVNFSEDLPKYLFNATRLN